MQVVIYEAFGWRVIFRVGSWCGIRMKLWTVPQNGAAGTYTQGRGQSTTEANGAENRIS